MPMIIFSAKLIEFPYLVYQGIEPFFCYKVSMGLVLQYKFNGILPRVSKKIKGCYASLGPDKWDLGWLTGWLQTLVCDSKYLESACGTDKDRKQYCRELAWLAGVCAATTQKSANTLLVTLSAVRLFITRGYVTAWRLKAGFGTLLQQPFQNRAGFVFAVAAACLSGIGNVTCRAAGVSLTSVVILLVKFWWDVSWAWPVQRLGSSTRDHFIS